MTQLVEIRRAEDPRDVIHRACEYLAAGELVAFPTETTYTVAASALNVAGVQRLAALSPQPTPALVLRTPDELVDYLKTDNHFGRKLIRRCWPGPIALQFDVSSCEHFWHELPDETRHLLTAETKHATFRVPGSPILNETLRLMPGPLVSLGEFQAGGTPLMAAQDVADRFQDRVRFIIDDGACRYGAPSTTVKLLPNGWEVVEEGVVSSRALGRLASEVYLFACTGNTCRSPMAEALFRKMLATRLQCGEEELVDRGYVVLSAGLSAAIGAPASPEAVELLAKEGIDLRNHESQPLTERLLQQVDYIFTMTGRHREAILSERPDLESTVWTLSPDGIDVADPIGGTPEDYGRCKEEIEQYLQVLVNRLALRQS